jgi:HemK-like putative methylase
VSGRSREWLAAHGDEAVAPAIADDFRALSRRRAAGEPLAYLIGWREFYGRRFEVSPAVLIPRPETELLVDWAIERAPNGGRVLELGTGSGAIAVTLALQRPDLQVTATDVSGEALAMAASNRDRLMGAAAARLRLLRGDWYRPLAVDLRVDLVLSNPPYISTDDPHLQVVLFMKGTAQFPMCGFSGRAIQILKACGVKDLVTVNVLEDEAIRQGIKEYANWPTIPQLYVEAANSSAARTS